MTVRKKKVLKGEKEAQIFVGVCKECFEKQLDLDNIFNIKRTAPGHEVVFPYSSKFKIPFPFNHIATHFTLKCLFPAI